MFNDFPQPLPFFQFVPSESIYSLHMAMVSTFNNDVPSGYTRIEAKCAKLSRFYVSSLANNLHLTS